MSQIVILGESVGFLMKAAKMWAPSEKGHKNKYIIQNPMRLKFVESHLSVTGEFYKLISY